MVGEGCVCVLSSDVVRFYHLSSQPCGPAKLLVLRFGVGVLYKTNEDYKFGTASPQ